MCEVYHAVNPNFGMMDRPEPKWPRDFALVAKIKDESTIEETLKRAFNLTTTYADDWWDNKKIEIFGKPSRSSNVGDVVVVSDVPFICTMNNGWQEILGG